MLYPTCERPCCNRPGQPNEIYTTTGTAYALGSCNLCHPRSLDELFSRSWNGRKVIEVDSGKGGLHFRLCEAHIKAVAAAFNRGRLP